MTRQEQYILLGIVTMLILGGAISVKLSGSARLSEHQNPVHGAGKATAGMVRRQLANATETATAATAERSYGTWQAPHWQIKDPLRANHPLFRRPAYIGENRHKVMTGGWDNWYYNPPGEVYF